MTLRRALCLLVLILIAAAGVRCYKLGLPGTTFDERYSVMGATGHMGDWQTIPMNRVMAPPDFCTVAHQASWRATWGSPDVHPPLYATLLRLWRNIFGESDAAARSLSVLASLAAIVGLFDFGRTMIGPGPALWACAIMAAAYPQIRYAQEERDYALWLALGMAASAAAARLIVLGPGWRRAVALGVSVSGMLLTHFFAIGTVVALAVWCAVWLRGRALRQAIIVSTICLPFVLLIGIHTYLQGYGHRHDADWLAEPGADHVAQTFQRLMLTPAELLTTVRPGTEYAATAAAAAYVLPLLLCRRSPVMLWCGLYLCCGAGLIFALDLLNRTHGLTEIRYTLAASPALYLLLAALPVRQLLRHAMPMLAVIGCILALVLELPADHEVTFKGQWRLLGADVRRLARPGDVVVFASRADVYLGEPKKMYEGTAFYCRPIPCDVLLLDQPPDAAAQERLAKAAHVWVVTPTPPATAAEFLPGWHVETAGLNRRFAGTVWRASVTIGP